MSESVPVLYIWPGQWGLLSIDPPCLVAALYLQMTMPGKYRISYCTNPDVSPSGVLPFLMHEQQVVSPLSSILTYLSGLKGTAVEGVMDSTLSAFERSQKLAWCSHVEANLGNLCLYMLYSLPDNWAKLTHPTMVFVLPVPQRYYVPGRIRNTHRPRLEAAGLWNQHLNGSKTQKSSPEHKDKIAQAFQREKVLQTARASLDIYVRLLEKKHFVYYNRVSTLDIMLAAHVLLILKPPFPDKLLSNLLAESYPALVSHAETLLARSLESPAPMYGLSRDHSVWSLLPSLSGGETRERRTKSEEEIRHERMSWGWLSLAVGSVGLYLLTMGNPLQIQKVELD
ncbi:hypothetical protein B0H10DRAFT_1786622 [Mycena sp. CBHHK59/15]|nr:hypothetical protein B0H10DRAFT_1786622 [Mycena sp. CBHHK59/15]